MNLNKNSNEVNMHGEYESEKELMELTVIFIVSCTKSILIN